MLKLTLEETAALQLVLNFCSVEEIITSAMHGFTRDEDEANVLDKEKSDVCWKALTFLK